VIEVIFGNARKITSNNFNNFPNGFQERLKKRPLEPFIVYKKRYSNECQLPV